MKVTYQAVVDTQKKVIRVYGRKLNATYDHITYRTKQRAIFIEGLTANQMNMRLDRFKKQGFKVRYSVYCKGGFLR